MQEQVGGTAIFQLIPAGAKYGSKFFGRTNTLPESPSPGSYRPVEQLPMTKDGVPIPSCDTPHTQLGTNIGRNGPYTVAREFGYNGQRIRDIHFTDHGRPGNHTNPHQHPSFPNPTGGTPIFGGPEPFTP